MPPRRCDSLRLIGYVRASTEEQVRHGLTIPAQRSRLAAYAKACGHSLVRLEEDPGVSGAVAPAAREGLSRALGSIRKGDADGLLILKLDRLSRRTRDVLDLVDACEREDWRLLSVSESLDTGTAGGRMVLTVLGAMAQMEREQVGERTRTGMAQILAEGRARSRFVPFGYRTASGATTAQAGDREALVLHDGEQRILRTMHALQSRGKGPRRIATALNVDAGANPRTGRPWTPGNVQSVLRTAERRRTAGA